MHTCSRPSSYFKYTSAETASLILENKTLRWSSPLLFNDPFDVRIRLSFGLFDTSLREKFRDRWLELLRSPKDIPLRPGSTIDQDLINDPDCRLYLISHIDEMVDESLQEMAKYEKFMNETRYMPMLRQSRVLCKSEVPDSHLMWSHYSDFHKGVVLELGTSDPDSAWNGSRQVLYSDRSVIGFDNTRWIDYFCSVGPPPPGDSFADAHLLTKHNDWAYEKEWRTFWKGDADVPGIMDIPYEPHEIDAVYFGIRCSKQIRSDLMNKAAQSGIKPRYFSATFDEYRHSLVFEPYE